jgi:hypothetical protein
MTYLVFARQAMVVFYMRYISKKPNYDKNILPSNVAGLVDGKVNIEKWGPNCWNATILFFNPKEEVKFVEQSDMVNWLATNTEEDPMKRCAPGSIVAFYNEDMGLIHTAIYVGIGTLYHKRGVGGDWEVITERRIRQIYFETDRYEYRIFKGAA